MIQSGSLQTLEQNVRTIIDNMYNNPMEIMNNEIYNIPVVFHVIHLGETEGEASNIDGVLIENCLQQLNDDFKNSAMNGYDVGINFCFAKQDPNGCPTIGINRISGMSVPGYYNIGINSSNEIEVKSLSVWPNDSYINIWIVHDITSSPGEQILGFATPPNSSPLKDGIVLLAEAVGQLNQSHLLTHEMGHFFNLYHTFHDTEDSDCINLGDCHQQGDMICETRAHVRILSAPCD